MTDLTTITPIYDDFSKPLEVSSQTFEAIYQDEGGRVVYLKGDPRGSRLLPSEALKLAEALADHAGYAIVPAKTPATLHGADAEDERQGWNLDAISAAIEYGRVVDFSYEKDQSPRTIERRVLKPEALETTNAGKLVVRGEDQERDATRVFRLDRIVGHVSAR